MIDNSLKSGKFLEQLIKKQPQKIIQQHSATFQTNSKLLFASNIFKTPKTHEKKETFTMIKNTWQQSLLRNSQSIFL